MPFDTRCVCVHHLALATADRNERELSKFRHSAQEMPAHLNIVRVNQASRVQTMENPGGGEMWGKLGKMRNK